jgi:hypothetical protein
MASPKKLPLLIKMVVQCQTFNAPRETRQDIKPLYKVLSSSKTLTTPGWLRALHRLKAYWRQNERWYK